MDSEIKIKLDRLGKFMDRHGLDGVFLNHRANFAWITGGKNNYIAGNSPNGVAGILATRDSRICFTNTIEGPRFANEELTGTGIEVITFPWYDGRAGQKTLKELIAGRKIAADVADNGDCDRFGAGCLPLPEDFVQLRWALTEQEIQRYREGGKRTSAAIETACRRISRNMTEHEIAAALDAEVRNRSLLPVVTLVAADDRVAQYRHPIPTDLRASRYCMLVTCASFGGLISNMTRFVSFQPLPAEIKKKQQAVCNVDAAVNLSTKPGKTLGEMFKVLEKAYAVNGFEGEFALHHQGGSTGYAGREAFADPTSDIRVLENQAFAWNPSITGVKCEDTIVCRAAGIEMITPMSADWPKVRGTFEDQSLDRPDILVR
ncbi:MAG TPA: M24 family metallopeptidase [Tepidisphaeraceae bacterium]|jgi:Xaa-Pro aminopeptidase|nr:M24 family metallopeptidase [Tepidisphaeraceae bacterium]